MVGEDTFGIGRRAYFEYTVTLGRSYASQFNMESVVVRLDQATNWLVINMTHDSVCHGFLWLPSMLTADVLGAFPSLFILHKMILGGQTTTIRFMAWRAL